MPKIKIVVINGIPVSRDRIRCFCGKKLRLKKPDPEEEKWHFCSKECRRNQRKFEEWLLK